MASNKSFDSSDGVWRTIGGRRIFIRNKQSLSDAMKESGKFKKASDITRNEYQNAKAEVDVMNAQKELLANKDSSKTDELHEKYTEARKANEDLKREPIEDKYTNDLEGKHIAKAEPTKEYTSKFLLEAEVNDFDSAQAYLTDDDMTQYVPEELKGVITKAEWTLDDESSGHVSIQTTRDLTDSEKESLQNWIDGQNSDGLGESFEQQDFAENYYDPYTGDGPYTYREAESEISNRFDNMDPDEYSDYLTEYDMENAMDTWMEENGMDHIEDDETYEMAREEILRNPEEYLEWEAIDDAKQKATEGDDYYNMDSWYNMSSIRRSGDGFEEKDLKPSKSISDDEYSLYKKAKEDPNSIDPMTENSTDWEALDKKYKDKYDYEKRSIEANKPAGQKTSDLMKENNVKTFADEIRANEEIKRMGSNPNTYSSDAKEDIKNNLRGIDNTKRQLSDLGYNAKGGEEITFIDKDTGKMKTVKASGFGVNGEIYYLNNPDDFVVQDIDIKDVVPNSKSDIEAMRRYLNNTVIEKDNGSVYAKPGRRWEVLEKDKSAYGKEIYKVRDEKGNVQWKPASDFYDNNSKSNDWVRNAFNKYKQEHPNTKLSLEDFMKNYKK